MEIFLITTPGTTDTEKTMSTLALFLGTTQPYRPTGPLLKTALKFIRYDSLVIIDYLSYLKLFCEGQKEMYRVGRFSFHEIIVC